MQFCVSKSPPFNVTSLITIQLACNNTEVVNPLHPQLIRRLPINRFLFLMWVWPCIIVNTWKLKGQLDATDWFLYCKTYCLLNMFRAPLCPSSGAQWLFIIDLCDQKKKQIYITQ